MGAAKYLVLFALVLPGTVACGAGASEPAAEPRKPAAPPEPQLPKTLGLPPQAYQPGDEEPGPPPPVDPRLLAVVAQHPAIAGWMPVPLLQVDAPGRALVVLWPAFDPRRRLTESAEVLGFVVQLDPAPRIVDGPFEATHLGPAEAAARLGTGDFEVRERGAGLQLLSIGAQLAAIPAVFVEAIDRGDRSMAIDQAVLLSRLHGPWNVGGTVSELLLLAARHGLVIDHLSTQPPAGGLSSARLSVRTEKSPPVAIDVPLRRVATDRVGGWVVTEPGPALPFELP